MRDNTRCNIRASHRPGLRARGFTLIELLVVVSIIALLAAILIPALQKSRQMARKLDCLSRVRQLALASCHYANDFSDYTPSGFYTSGYGMGMFTRQLFPAYMGNVARGGSLGGDALTSFLHCPAVDAVAPTSAMQGYYWPVGPSNYFANVYAMGTSGDGAFNSFPTLVGRSQVRARYAQFTRPSQIMMYGDNRDSAISSDWEARCVPTTSPPLSGFGQNFEPENMAKHLNGANVSFVDGHGGDFSAEELLDNENDLWGQIER